MSILIREDIEFLNIISTLNSYKMPGYLVG